MPASATLPYARGATEMRRANEAQPTPDDIGAHSARECTRCAARNASHLRFCEDCGTPLEPRCPACQGPVRPGKPYCGHCGTALPGAAPCRLQPVDAGHALFNEGPVPEGERKQVTVLFADLKGSLELLAERDPEDARKLIQPVLDRMIRAVRAYDGTVNQVLGDGVMALFGAPVAQEDHAVRACHAALDMHAAIRSYGEELRRSHDLPLLQLRIGLNSGEVVVGSAGSDLHMEYTAVGHTTFLAARMEQLAAPGSTLLSTATLQLADGYVSVRAHGPVNVKGLRDPIEVYELTGRPPARSRLRVAAERGLSPFVGRDGELDRLQRALERAGAGRGQALALVGEPGIGKSRLLREFTRSPRTRDWGLAEARCLAFGKGSAYQPIVHLLRTYFQIDDGDDPARTRTKVAERLLALDPALQNAVSPTLGLLNAAADDPEWLRLDPLQRRQRILEASRRLLLRESQARPLVLVFEDLQWVDGETQALLAHLVDHLVQERVLLLHTYRHGYQPPWAGRSHFTELRLDRLPGVGAAAMVDHLLGPQGDLEGVKQMLLARTEGNPLFLEESVRSLQEIGAIAGERGAYRLRENVTAIQVPATVHAILAARIDRLQQEDKHLLQCAAVIGKDVPFALLRAIAGVPDEQMGRGLRRLLKAEFLDETGASLQSHYTFKHALAQEVAYGGVLLECRKALHRTVVGAIEEIHAGRLHEHIDVLAAHAWRGELWDKAALYARRAGMRALGQSANREAAAAFDQALHALAQLPQTRSTIEQAIDLRCELRNALYPLAELSRLHDLLLEAARLSETIGDRVRLERVASYLTHYLWATGRHREALAIGKRSLPRGALDESTPVQLVVSNWVLGQAHHALGRYRPAVAFFTDLLRRVEADMVGNSFGSHGLPVVFARSWKTRALSELGRFDEGLACAQEALRIAEVLDHPFSLYVANQGMGYLHLRRGAITEALPFLQRSYALCMEWNLAIGKPTAAALLGHAQVCADRVAEGLPLLAVAVEECRAIGVLFAHALEAAWLAEAQLRANDLSAAQRTADYAMRIATEQEALGYKAWTLRVQGQIAAASAHGELARQHLQHALRLARSLEMQPLAAQCERDLASLAETAGAFGKERGNALAGPALR